MKTSILFITAAAFLAPASGFAAEVKAQTASVSSIEGLPSESYTSSSITAFGAPPEEKEEQKRRHAVGFVPKVPPPPDAEGEKADKKVVASEPMPANAQMDTELDISELKGTKDTNETSPMDEGDGEIVIE